MNLNVPAIGGGAGGVDVQDEGVAQGAATTLNFTGAGVTATVAAGVATVAVPGGSGSIPAGVIVMWSGTLASVPAGWALCDGAAGTPDLRDRFIKGWSAGVDPGGTGGSSAYTPAGTNAAPIFTGAALGTHQHELPLHLPAGNFRHLGNFFGAGTSRAGVTGAGGGLPADTTAAAVALAQAVSAGTPAGTVSAPTFTGTGATIEPPFFKLAFIIKL